MCCVKNHTCLLFLFLPVLFTLQLCISFFLLCQQLPNFNSTLHKKCIIINEREEKVRQERELMKAITGVVDSTKHTSSVKHPHSWTNTHLLLQGLQVHISICVVDCCRWTEDFDSRNLSCLQGHMKQKSYDEHTLFCSTLHFLPPSGAHFTKWESSGLPLNDWKITSIHRVSIQVREKQYIFSFPFSCISWCRFFCFYFPNFWELCLWLRLYLGTAVLLAEY